MHEGHHDAPAGKGTGRRDSTRRGLDPLPFADADREGAAARRRATHRLGTTPVLGVDRPSGEPGIPVLDAR